nr:hypothetical protein B0A51_05603 [Rachicladosporium sp. CCFEE 5018]
MQPAAHDQYGTAAIQACVPSDTLATHVHSLPPELFEIIRRLTLCPVASVETSAASGEAAELMPDEGNYIKIDGTWSPPSLLQVDATTRAAYAKVYYSTHVFDFIHSAGSRESSLTRCMRWLKTIDTRHLGYIRQIRLHASHRLRVPIVECSDIWRAFQAGVPKSQVCTGYHAEHMLSYGVYARHEQWERIYRRLCLGPSALPVAIHQCDQQPKCPAHRESDCGIVLFTELRYQTGDDDPVRSVWMPVEYPTFQGLLNVLIREFQRVMELEMLVTPDEYHVADGDMENSQRSDRS